MELCHSRSDKSCDFNINFLDPCIERHESLHPSEFGAFIWIWEQEEIEYE